MNDNLIKMNLQLLADDSDTTETETDNNPSDKKGTEQENPDNPAKKTGKDEKKYSDEDLDRIISAKFKKLEERKEKEINEAKKLANMTAQEKIEYERDQLKERLEELESKNILSEMSKTARGILKNQNIDIPDDLLSVLVTKEAESTKKNVESFVEMFNKAVEDAVNEKLKSKSPRKGSTKTMTKEEILNIKDRTERQRKIAENLELFK